jgi:hypothetical protein
MELPPIYLSLSASDLNTGNSGIAATYYTIDGGSVQSYTAGTYVPALGSGGIDGNGTQTVT